MSFLLPELKDDAVGFLTLPTEPFDDDGTLLFTSHARLGGGGGRSMFSGVGPYYSVRRLPYRATHTSMDSLSARVDRTPRFLAIKRRGTLHILVISPSSPPSVRPAESVSSRSCLSSFSRASSCGVKKKRDKKKRGDTGPANSR